MWNSRFVGFRNFIDFFNGYNFWILIKNTLGLSLYEIVIGVPIPIFVALVLNEMGTKSKRVLQTVLYAPHFISTVVLVGIINVMFSPSMGVVNTVIEALGGESIYFMGKPEYFRHIYAWSGIWQEMGWSAIIYLAALSSVDPAHLEAAEIDGANKWKQFVHITLPQIKPITFYLIIMGFIGTLQSFANFQIMTPDGGPNQSTLTMGFRVYEVAMGYDSNVPGWGMGYASAMGWIVGLVVMVFVALYFYFNNRKEKN